jgi:hypothetical protein
MSANDINDVNDMDQTTQEPKEPEAVPPQGMKKGRRARMVGRVADPVAASPMSPEIVIQY